MSNAYSGSARLDTGGAEFNRMEFLARQVLNRACTCTLVRVEEVDPVKMLVGVKPLIGQIDGYGTIVPHGVIHNVPYLRVQGGASAIIIDPVAGDIGLAVFAQHDISVAKKTKAPAGPGSRRKFDWADAIYLGGLLNGAPTQFVRLGPDGITLQAAAGQSVTILSDTGLTIDTPTAHFTGDITTGAGSTFNGKSFDSHTHGGIQTGSGTSGPPS